MVELLVADIRGPPLAPSAAAVYVPDYVPDEPEWESPRARWDGGIPLPKQLAKHLRTLAQELGVAVPPSLDR